MARLGPHDKVIGSGKVERRGPGVLRLLGLAEGALHR